MSTPIPSYPSSSSNAFISSSSVGATSALSGTISKQPVSGNGSSGSTTLRNVTQHRRHGSTGHMFSTAGNYSSINGNYYASYTPVSRSGQINSLRQQHINYPNKGPSYVHTSLQYQPIVTTIGHTNVSTLLPNMTLPLRRSCDNLYMHGVSAGSASNPVDLSEEIATDCGDDGLLYNSDWNESEGGGVTSPPPPVPLPCLEGLLNKWTNLLHGWQERFFVLSDGTLSYYKSKEEQKLGCRGSLRLGNAIVRPHEYDDCRFEIRVGDSIWYLRCSNLSERHTWIQGLECHRIADTEPLAITSGTIPYNFVSTAAPLSSVPNSVLGMRHNSLVSLTSTASHSIASASSFQKGHRLKEKLAEMETFKEILCKQVDTLQTYFDACSQVVQQDRNHQASSAAGFSHLLELPEEPLDNTMTAQTLSDRLSGEGCLSDETMLLHQQQRSRTPTHALPIPCERSHSPSISSSSCGHCLEEGGDSDNSGPGTYPALGFEAPVHSEKEIEAPHNGSNTFNGGIDELSPGKVSEIVNPAQQTACQPQRGFLSRFFTFRSTPNATAVPATQSSLTQEASSEDNLSSYLTLSPVAYSDLKQVLARHGSNAPDFRGEAITFKATTMGILATLSHCIDLLMQSEDQWRKRVELEREKRARLEESFRCRLEDMKEELRQQREYTATLERQLELVNARNGRVNSANSGNVGTALNKMHIVGPPDMEEGPNCTIGEEEFFDALEAQLDKLEMQEEMLEALRVAGQSLSTAVSPMSPQHPLYAQVQKVVNDHLILCDPTQVNLSEEAGWQLIARDGEMRIYKREMESSDGKVLDPLQATHIINGITAHELCLYFWDVKYRMEWEFTIDQPPIVLEVCGEDTLVLHQVYKRVWPASQRDAVFWSHIRRVTANDLRQFCSTSEGQRAPVNTAPLPNGEEDYWMVMNYSTDYKAPDLTKLPNQMIRLNLDVVMIGQTLRRDGSRPCSRDNICCRLLYAASIDPGGWAPASVLRKLAQREYPRFIKQFSQYVVDQTKNQLLLL